MPSLAYQFLLEQLAVDEASIRNRDRTRPIHFSGCYYYENTLDSNWHCDCDEDGEASKKALLDIQSKRELLARFAEDEEVIRILSIPYQETL